MKAAVILRLLLLLGAILAVVAIESCNRSEKADKQPSGVNQQWMSPGQPEFLQPKSGKQFVPEKPPVHVLP